MEGGNILKLFKLAFHLIHVSSQNTHMTCLKQPSQLFSEEPEVSTFYKIHFLSWHHPVTVH